LPTGIQPPAGCSRSRNPRQRKKVGLNQAWKPVPVSGVENAAYYYSTYNARMRLR
jgi:carbamoyl-phosphate synthase large subunit